MDLGMEVHHSPVVLLGFLVAVGSGNGDVETPGDNGMGWGHGMEGHHVGMDVGMEGHHSPVVLLGFLVAMGMEMGTREDHGMGWGRGMEGHQVGMDVGMEVHHSSVVLVGFFMAMGSGNGDMETPGDNGMGWGLLGMWDGGPPPRDGRGYGGPP